MQVGSDSSGKPLGLHPKLTGLLDIFNQGRLALIQRTGYENSSRSHFQGTDIWSHGESGEHAGHRLARTLSRHAAARRSIRSRLEHRRARRRTRCSRRARRRCRRFRARAATRSPARTPAPKPQPSGRARRASRRTCRSNRPHLSRSSTTSAQAAIATLDRVASVVTLRAERHVSEQRLRPGAAGGRRRDGRTASARECSGCRPAASTRTRRRTRTANGAYVEADGDAQRRPARVLQRPAEPGAAQRHAGALVLGVRPPHHRERQPGHRSRRRRA